MRVFLRWYCRHFHGPTALMFPGGPCYECRICGERFEVSWLDGPVLALARPVNVRVIAPVKRRPAAKVRRMPA